MIPVAGAAQNARLTLLLRRATVLLSSTTCWTGSRGMGMGARRWATPQTEGPQPTPLRGHHHRAVAQTADLPRALTRLVSGTLRRVWWRVHLLPRRPECLDRDSKR